MARFKTIALDTNIFIYHFRRLPKFTALADSLFDLLAQNNLKAVTSLVTLIELLSFKTTQTKLQELLIVFDMTPNLSVIEVNRQISLEAANIRRKYSFSLPDAVQLATAIVSSAQVFVTADKRLKKFKELPVKLLG